MSRIRDSFLFAILNLSHWKWVYTLKCIEKKSVFKMNQIVKSVFMWISQFLAGNAINMSVNCAISVHPYSGRGKSQRNWLRGRKTYDDIEIIEPISRTWIMTTSKERKKKLASFIIAVGLANVFIESDTLDAVCRCYQNFRLHKIVNPMNYLAHVDRTILCHWNVCSRARSRIRLFRIPKGVQ